MHLAEYIAASVILTVMPGPDILYVLVQGLTRGRRAGIAVSLGLSSGLLVHTTAAALGLSLVIAGSPLLFNIVKFAGVLYLLYMGVKAFLGRNRGEGPALEYGDTAQDEEPFFRLYKRGVAMNLLNPKVIIFFLAFLPQFVDTQTATPKADIFILGGIFALQAVAVFSTVSLLAGVISERFSLGNISRKAVAVINAVVYWAIAAVFLLSKSSL